MPPRRWAHGWPALRSEGVLREKVYGIARALSIIFVVDGLFLAVTVAYGGYAYNTYALVSFIPLFIPAFFVGLVISAIYAHRFARRSWTVRKDELLFFLLFFLAVVAKVAVVVEAQWADRRDASRVSSGR